MSLTVVILLLAVAIGLVLLEIFFVPGVGIPGIIGAVLMVISLVLAYQLSSTIGHYTLGATAVVSVLLLVLAFRSKTWDRLSQKEEITSHVTATTDQLTVGQQGVAVSRLNPIGNVRFGEELYEARSRGNFIDDGTNVEIVNIEGIKVTVKPV